ncbi:MAG: hypothetical protein ABSD67_10635 [Terracidiphilus sp.]
MKKYLVAAEGIKKVNREFVWMFIELIAGLNAKLKSGQIAGSLQSREGQF